MMLFNRDTWSEIYHALDKNKARTLITMIGVAWGMLLFVFLLGLVRGMRNGFDRDLKGTSTNSLFIGTKATSIPYDGFGRGRTFQLKLDDVDALKKNYPEIQMIAPRQSTSATVIHGSQNKTTSIYGDFPSQNKMFVKKIIEGRFITEEDIQRQAKVLVIGDGVINELYRKEDKVIGSIMKVNGIAFTVVGIYQGDEQSFEGKEAIFMPFTTFGKMFNRGENMDVLIINVKDEADIKQAELSFIDFLKKRHRVSPDDTQAFSSFNLGEIFNKLFNFMKGLEFLTVVVGFLTLLAGVIAVSSILLITVKERTKEFGIRRALGAQPVQIIGQILLESAVITFISGLLGIIAGTIILFWVNEYVDSMETSIPMVNSSVNIYILLGSFALVLLMAVLAGLIPALRAIAIKPIDALREE